MNKSQFKAISDIKKISSDAFQHIVNTAQSNSDFPNDIHSKSKNSASIVLLKEISAREIRQAAEKLIQKGIKAEQGRQRDK